MKPGNMIIMFFIISACHTRMTPVPEAPIPVVPDKNVTENKNIVDPIVNTGNDGNDSLVISAEKIDSSMLELIEHSMTLRQKIAQMIMVRIRGDYYPMDHWMQSDMKRLTTSVGIGGVILFGGSIQGAFDNIQKYQTWSEIPLLVAADYERGTGQWFDGGTLFPPNMAIAATGIPQFAYDQGRITAQEAKSLGVQISFAPVMDVNNNPDNPIINFRSYGDNADQVSEFGCQFIAGFQSEGLFACAKHFPGHGNTSVDSHMKIPFITAGLNELNTIELKPFRDAVDQGVKMVMIGHIAVTELDKSQPASFSYKITTGLLRDQFGFDGLIVTDGMEMAGLTNLAWAGESAVRAVESGADILLLPMDVKSTIDAVEQAVRIGRLSEDRINNSVRRILEAKRDLELFTPGKSKNFEMVESTIGIKSHIEKAKEIARKSITVVKSNGLLPLRPEKIRNLGHVLLTTDDNGKEKLYPFIKDISLTQGDVSEYFITDKLSDGRIAELLSELQEMDVVIVSLLNRIHSGKGRSSIDKTHDDLLTKLDKTGIPMLVISFGSPYLDHYDHLANYMCAYGYGSVSLKAAADAVWGRIPVIGKLPISLSNDFPNGTGNYIPPRARIFQDSKSTINLSKAWSVLDSAIDKKIFPGAQIFIARDSQVIASYAVGNQTYDTISPEVTTKTMYDVASLTKVLVTTPVAMKMIEKRLLGLDQTVSQFFPEFNEGLKKDVTIKHLLTHSSGLKPYIRFYLDKEIHTKQDILEAILNSELESKPGEKYAYSDLGIILLGAILEKVSNSNLDILAKRYIFKPFKMDRTNYNPSEQYLSDIAPTEIDSIYRNQLVHGFVHDENAYLMGGIAPHAGVFSTAEDIANYSQMLLNGGTFLGRRYFSKSIINQFSKRQNLPEGSDRAIGWDTPSRNGNSSAGDLFSPSSFGHLGFTGTSLWIDPEQKIVIVMLTNRVYPTRNNHGIHEVRRRFHTEVMKALLR